MPWGRAHLHVSRGPGIQEERHVHHQALQVVVPGADPQQRRAW